MDSGSSYFDSMIDNATNHDLIRKKEKMKKMC